MRGRPTIGRRGSALREAWGEGGRCRSSLKSLSRCPSRSRAICRAARHNGQRRPSVAAALRDGSASSTTHLRAPPFSYGQNRTKRDHAGFVTTRPGMPLGAGTSSAVDLKPIVAHVPAGSFASDAHASDPPEDHRPLRVPGRLHGRRLRRGQPRPHRGARSEGAGAAPPGLHRRGAGCRRGVAGAVRDHRALRRSPRRPARTEAPRGSSRAARRSRTIRRPSRLSRPCSTRCGWTGSPSW